MVNMLKPALGNLAYSMILADTFRSLVATFFGQDISRTISLVVITLVGIFPLCLMKNLDALAPFSILGTAGILLTAACMAMRYFDGSYDMERDGRFLQDLPEDLQPLFGRGGGGGGEQRNGAWSRDVLVFVAMVFEAFVAHYNAPRFMTELKDASLTRFRVVVGNAFGFSSLVYVLMTAFGFLTFGGNCDGYILNNYSTNDHLATICRVAIAFSILFTYPITFMGFRDGILDILELPMEQQTSINMNIITIFLLIIITILAALFKDLGFINAVGGGTLATAIVFVFPALMYRAVIRAQVHPPTPGQRREVSFTMGLLVLGVIMGATGVVVELQQQ
jgi:amino acid permease